MTSPEIFGGGHTLSEAEQFAMVRVGLIPSGQVDFWPADVAARFKRGDRGEGDIHPDTAALIASMQERNEQLRAKTAATKALLLAEGDSDAATDAAEILWISSGDPERADFLEWCYYHRDAIGRRPFSRVLAESWQRPKTGSLVTSWGFPISWVTRMFQHALPEHLMDAEELAEFNRLPLEIVAFRGCSGVTLGKARCGMSWTLDRDKAIWFARRFGDLRGDPLCLEATIQKRNVFAYFGVPERELVVRSGRVAKVRSVPV